jgi:deoxyribodipyrimidine photo-lyase
LLIHWRAGENWFWDTLVDADFANNAANWQWVAGSGADAAPYFRIFNPILQGEKFDPNGDYVRKWVPERAQLPNKLIHKPNAKQAGLLQENYPAAMIEHGFARKRALEAFASLKK